MNELKKIINTLKGRIQKTKAKIAAVSGVIEESISEVCDKIIRLLNRRSENCFEQVRDVCFRSRKSK